MKRTANYIFIVLGILLFLTSCAKQVISSAVEYTIYLYTVDEAASSHLVDTKVQAILNSQPTPLLIAEAYRDAFFHPDNFPAHMPKLSWNEITCDEDGLVVIDLTKEGLQRISGGSFLEITTLSGLAKSIILGDPTVEAVTYSVNGEKYSSGHFEFDLGVPHTTRAQLTKQQMAVTKIVAAICCFVTSIHHQ